MIHPKQTLDEVFLMENPHQVGKLAGEQLPRLLF